MVWNATLQDSSSIHNDMAKSFIMENVSPALREYIASNFQTLVRTGTVKDVDWKQTAHVKPGELLKHRKPSRQRLDQQPSCLDYE